MSRPQSVETLEAKKADLLTQIKQIDQAIKAAQQAAQVKKSKAIMDALAARGLLDADIETVLAAIASANIPVLGIAKTDQLKATYGEPDQPPNLAD